MVTITEDYVSFETAKLLKEKGFDEPCDNYYDQSSDEPQQLTLDEMYYSYDEFLKAPTHQMAMKWLREVHNIDFIIFHEKLPNDCYWARIERHPFTEFQQEPEYKTYEESVEAALKYSLKNLI